jgi:hypothetical protein
VVFSRLKSAAPARQEQARLEVEHAEDDLVQKTEVAIGLMKAVLENVGLRYLQLRIVIHSFQAGTSKEP